MAMQIPANETENAVQLAKRPARLARNISTNSARWARISIPRGICRRNFSWFVTIDDNCGTANSHGWSDELNEEPKVAVIHAETKAPFCDDIVFLDGAKE
jgi:hypothetical protein